MKHEILLIAIFLMSVIMAIPSSAQQSSRFINIGSTKEEVKRLLGEPSSISKFDSLNEEEWTYTKRGSATIVFKHGKINEFDNKNGILPIGDINKTNDQSPINLSKKEKSSELKNVIYNISTGETMPIDENLVSMNPVTGEDYYNTNPLGIEHRDKSISVEPELRKEDKTQWWIGFGMLCILLALLGIYISNRKRSSPNR